MLEAQTHTLISKELFFRCTTFLMDVPRLINCRENRSVLIVTYLHCTITLITLLLGYVVTLFLKQNHQNFTIHFVTNHENITALCDSQY